MLSRHLLKDTFTTTNTNHIRYCGRDDSTKSGEVRIQDSYNSDTTSKEQQFYFICITLNVVNRNCLPDSGNCMSPAAKP
ncbi:hypothetical protein L2E82_40842 [Cichorium intybus]|uniref:Uncharacterized protein n=1 Tax=Cichorium intybus TaxID=13427 RepID=A0ACB9AMV3_CICIN|nr:hypothetical protein L2E82_40842 [Cichorium intybus]